MLCFVYTSPLSDHMSTAAWSPHYKKDKELIERIQHKFTKMITDLNHLPYLERLHQLNLWTLEDRRIR